MIRKDVQRVTDVAVVLTWALPTMVCVLGIAMLLLTGNKASAHDTLSYWTAAKLLHTGANPYDSAGVLALQRANDVPAGFDALMLRNPPLMLPLIAPLGYFSLRVASLIWSSLLLGAFVASCWALWDKRNKTPLFLLLFGPALFCIMTGQSALFCLLGVALFLRFHRSRPFIAGVFLVLCALKPHLFVPVAAVFVPWCVFQRNWRVPAGVATALLAALAISFGLDPHGWSQYRAMMAAEPLQSEFIPCLGMALRTLAHGKPWAQYIPCLAASIVMFAIYVRNRERWDWVADGPLLLAVSIVFAPYAWITDQALLLPAVWQLLARNSSSLRAAAVIGAAMTIQFLDGVSFHSPWFLWSAPAWLALCVYGMRPWSTVPGILVAAGEEQCLRAGSMKIPVAQTVEIV
jgi:Glycosyltransferase family 87